jgi:hypothetical protein
MPDATEEEKAWEKKIESMIPQVGDSTPQPEHQLAYVMRGWIHYAYKHGDKTYAEFTDGTPLSPDYITYHNKE